jgi:hypothetical protein
MAGVEDAFYQAYLNLAQKEAREIPGIKITQWNFDLSMYDNLKINMMNEIAHYNQMGSKSRAILIPYWKSEKNIDGGIYKGELFDYALYVKKEINNEAPPGALGQKIGCWLSYVLSLKKPK